MLWPAPLDWLSIIRLVATSTGRSFDEPDTPSAILDLVVYTPALRKSHHVLQLDSALKAASRQQAVVPSQIGCLRRASARVVEAAEEGYEPISPSAEGRNRVQERRDHLHRVSNHPPIDSLG